MMFYVVLDPSKPYKYRNIELAVTELVRPGDQFKDDKPVYRVMWETDSKLKFPHGLPKWLLFQPTGDGDQAISPR